MTAWLAITFTVLALLTTALSLLHWFLSYQYTYDDGAQRLLHGAQVLALLTLALAVLTHAHTP